MGLTEQIEIRRHDELKKALGNVANGVNSLLNKKDDGVKQAMEKQARAIEQFAGSVKQLAEGVKSLPQPDAPAVNVVTNQDKVVDELKNLIRLMLEVKQEDDRQMKLMEERVAKLENRPIPIRLRPERSGYPGTIDYVVIEYKK